MSSFPSMVCKSLALVAGVQAIGLRGTKISGGNKAQKPQKPGANQIHEKVQGPGDNFSEAGSRTSAPPKSTETPQLEEEKVQKIAQELEEEKKTDEVNPGQINIEDIEDIQIDIVQAARWGETGEVKSLLENAEKEGVDMKAYVNEQNQNCESEQKTALHYAVEYGNEKMVYLLLATNSIDLDIEDRFGQTAYQLASNTYDQELEATNSSFEQMELRKRIWELLRDATENLPKTAEKAKVWLAEEAKEAEEAKKSEPEELAKEKKAAWDWYHKHGDGKFNGQSPVYQNQEKVLQTALDDYRAALRGPTRNLLKQ